MAVAASAYTEKTDEQKAITEMVRQFVDNEVLPIAEEHDHEDKFPDAARRADAGARAVRRDHPRGVRRDGRSTSRPTR